MCRPDVIYRRQGHNVRADICLSVPMRSFISLRLSITLQFFEIFIEIFFFASIGHGNSRAVGRGGGAGPEGGNFQGGFEIALIYLISFPRAPPLQPDFFKGN